MENWRLSKIEEELGKLNLESVVGGETGQYSSQSARNSDAHGRNDDFKIIIRPAYKKKSRNEEDSSRTAVRRFTEKYDSPHAVTKSDFDTEHSVKIRSPISQALQSSPLSSSNWDRAVEDNRPGTRSQPNGTAVQVAQGSNVSYKSDPSEYPAVSNRRFSPVPTILVVSGELSDKISQRNGVQSKIRPPTAAKPLCSSFRGHVPLNNNEHPNHSVVESGRKVHIIPETGSSHSPRPSTLPVVQPFAQTTRSTTICFQDNLQAKSPVDTLPQPPPDFSSREIHQELPVRQNSQSAIVCPSHVRGDNSPPMASDAKAFSRSEDLVAKVNYLSGHQGHYSEPRSSSQPEQRCEYIPAEAQKIQHLPSSYNNFYPLCGTLKSRRHHHPNAPTSDAKCEFLPPDGPGLSDEDRSQVEIFYRSHKTRVFAARCEANLYFGSARRHSSVLPSKSAATQAVETPGNWEFIRCGVPVLVLDTGESRRQRRLHIVLAEKGTGFVLWRDTVDHLTGYSRSADVGFHTMHLSMDHTKLAGLYFSDPIFASDFLDYLNNLTSDPADPLLNLSAGAKRRKDRKQPTNRKSKRKPIRREDISMPCCFTHVTKLDRNDGLDLLESDQLDS